MHVSRNCYCLESCRIYCAVLFTSGRGPSERAHSSCTVLAFDGGSDGAPLADFFSPLLSQVHICNDLYHPPGATPSATLGATPGPVSDLNLWQCNLLHHPPDHRDCKLQPQEGSLHQTALNCTIPDVEAMCTLHLSLLIKVFKLSNALQHSHW